MLIDWFTVGAQALNFLILVWLMKRFLYKPILSAIDTREKKIAAELDAADAKKAEAQKEHDAFTEKNDQFDQQRAALMSKATDDANAEGKRIVDEARKTADVLTAKRKEALQADAKSLTVAITRRTRDEVFAIARKTLADLATTSLEERMSEVFTRRLREIDGTAKACLAGAIHTASDPVVIQSAFEVPAEQRATIQNALNETFAANVPIAFKTAPDLISGIELTANGQKVVWSIDGYLTAMERGVNDALETKKA
jgi:F-type H+-transporting ATPase subunit b